MCWLIDPYFTVPQRGVRKGGSEKEITLQSDLKVIQMFCLGHCMVGSPFSDPPLGDGDYFANRAYPQQILPYPAVALLCPCHALPCPCPCPALPMPMPCPALPCPALPCPAPSGGGGCQAGKDSSRGKSASHDAPCLTRAGGSNQAGGHDSNINKISHNIILYH